MDGRAHQNQQLQNEKDLNREMIIREFAVIYIYIYTPPTSYFLQFVGILSIGTQRKLPFSTKRSLAPLTVASTKLDRAGSLPRFVTVTNSSQCCHIHDNTCLVVGPN